MNASLPRRAYNIIPTRSDVRFAGFALLFYRVKYVSGPGNAVSRLSAIGDRYSIYEYRRTNNEYLPPHYNAIVIQRIRTFPDDGAIEITYNITHPLL